MPEEIAQGRRGCKQRWGMQGGGGSVGVCYNLGVLLDIYNDLLVIHLDLFKVNLVSQK